MSKSPQQLRADAEKCRRLARGVADRRTVESLLDLAETYEAEADALERAPPAGDANAPEP